MNDPSEPHDMGDQEFYEKKIKYLESKLSKLHQENENLKANYSECINGHKNPHWTCVQCGESSGIALIKDRNTWKAKAEALAEAIREYFKEWELLVEDGPWKEITDESIGIVLIKALKAYAGVAHQMTEQEIKDCKIMLDDAREESK